MSGAHPEMRFVPAQTSYSPYFMIILLVVILWLEFFCKRMILLLRIFEWIVYRTLSLTCYQLIKLLYVSINLL